MKQKCGIAKRQRGVSLFEQLVVLLLSGVVITLMITQYSKLTKISYDQNIRVSTQLQAQAIAETITSELRMAGNGVPFHQLNFQISENNLSNYVATDPDPTEPILVSYPGANTTSRITFRLNETGEVYIVTQKYAAATDTTIFLTSVAGLAVNDPIYLTNSVLGEDDGFYGQITAVDTSAKSVSVISGTLSGKHAVFSPGAIFDKGSLAEEVSTIVYDSPSDGSGITRDAGYGATLLAPNSTMTLTYLDASLTAMTTPLVAPDPDSTTVPANSLQNLRAIRVLVNVRSNEKMSNGNYYTATAQQSIGIRNLNYNY